MADAFSIAPGMEVVGSDGLYVGRVHHLQGADIKLARKDSEGGGRHHLFPLDWVAKVEDQALRVHLNRTRDEIEAGWRQV